LGSGTVKIKVRKGALRVITAGISPSVESLEKHDENVVPAEQSQSQQGSPASTLEHRDDASTGHKAQDAIVSIVPVPFPVGIEKDHHEVGVISPE
jgi:hypothetical protein